MMTKLSQRLLLLVALFVGITTSACARPAEQTPTEPPVQGDTIEVMSTSMQRNIKNIADVTSLIDYLLSGAWPGPEPIDMWYLTGDRVGSNPWENQGVSSIGRGLIPLYPVGEFDENGEGQLSYTGFFGQCAHAHCFFSYHHNILL